MPTSRQWVHCTTLGVELFVGDLCAAAETVMLRVRSAAGGYVCHANAHVLVTARHDFRLRRALDGAVAVFPDGAPVAWLQRRLGFRAARRIGGPDLMPLIVRSGIAEGTRHYLLGGTEEVLKRLHVHLTYTYPGVLIVGSYAPSALEVDADEAAFLDLVRDVKPDVVWCAFGAPRQEIWMSRHSARLSPALVLGVGAAFDFLAQSKKRAPAWMQRSGLEWLHRLVHEPRRLAGRYLRSNGEFLIRAAAELSRAPR